MASADVKANLAVDRRERPIAKAAKPNRHTKVIRVPADRREAPPRADSLRLSAAAENGA